MFVHAVQGFLTAIRPPASKGQLPDCDTLETTSPANANAHEDVPCKDPTEAANPEEKEASEEFEDFSSAAANVNETMEKVISNGDIEEDAEVVQIGDENKEEVSNFLLMQRATKLFPFFHILYPDEREP